MKMNQEHVDQIMLQAAAAFDPYRNIDGKRRAAFLHAIADGIQAETEVGVAQRLLLQRAMAQVQSIFANPIFSSSCSRCQATLEIAQFLALAAPEQGPSMAVFLCNEFNISSACEANFGLNALGPIVTQVLANADVGGFDGQVRGMRSQCTDETDDACR